MAGELRSQLIDNNEFSSPHPWAKWKATGRGNVRERIIVNEIHDRAEKEVKDQ